MGIRGLTTYIATHADRFLEPYELYNCKLVIDGNSLASTIFTWHSKCMCAFGGDYDKYAHCVASFFIALQKSGVTPIVLFDGGYEEKKIYTVMQRLKGKIRLAKNVTPTSRDQFFPLLMKEVFKDVLISLKIPFAQCFFEADDEIAAIARMLECPVLSYDSDFYVYDVLYIPFSTVNIRAVKKPDAASNHPQYYISCKIFKIDNFLNQFGGLDKSLVPLMAILLGNDYIRRGIFKNFYSNLKLEKVRSMCDTQKKITALLLWLKNESVESAMEKVLLTLKKQYRSGVREKIIINTENYVQCSSNLLPYLCLSPAAYGSLNDSSSVAADSMAAMTVEESENNEADYVTIENDEDTCIDDVECTSDDSSYEQSENGSDSLCQDVIPDAASFATNIENMPDWLKNSFCQGNLPSYFIDILSRQTYFCSPQVEDYSLPFSHTISLPIMSIIYGLLSDKKIEKPLTYYSRNVYLCPERQILEPSYYNEVYGTFPALAQLAFLSGEIRESFLFQNVGISNEKHKIVQEFPSEWRLFVVALVVWIRDCKHPGITNCHLHSMLMGIIALYVIDGKIGYIRSKGMIIKALNSRHKTQQSDDRSSKETFLVSICDVLKAVTREDCFSVAEALLPFHSVDDRLQVNVKLYSVTTVHAFAQFQSILFHLMHLNALLNFPLPQCKPARFFSGTFIYNVYTNLNKRVDVMSYIQLILSCGPSVCDFYKVLAKVVLQLLPDLNVIIRKKKRHRNSKHHRKELAQNTYEEEHTFLSEEVSFIDMNNKFSALGLCDD